MELIRAAEILIEKIKKDYKDDIAIVVIMGSYIYNETHSKSDLDMFYVPKTNRGCNLGFTFILDGVGFDYWPVSWDRLERIAGYEERITSIITEGKVVYFSTENDMERFNDLKRLALDTADRQKFIYKAAAKLDEAYKEFFKLSNSRNLSDARIHAVKIIDTVTYALALLNRITIKRGRGKLKKEIMSMPIVPENFARLFDVILECDDIDFITKSYCKLIENTGSLIKHEQDKFKEKVSFTEKLTGFYEEMINFYNKIYHACEIADKYCALSVCVDLTCEIAQFFTDTGIPADQLPDIVGAFDPEKLDLLVSEVHKHQERLIGLLTGNGVKIRQFASIDELEEYMYQL